MAKDKIFWDDEEYIGQQIKKDWEDYKKYIDGKVKYNDVDNGKIPISRDDLGRNCPRCQGRMEVKELRDSGYVNVYCKSCRAEFFINDVDNDGEITDKIYRSIPLNVQQKWENFRKEQKKNFVD